MSAAAFRRPLLAAIVAALSLAGAAAAHHGPENVLPVSKGVYRLPFEDGVEVRVGSDHITHRPHNRLDMSSLDNADFTHNVVAPGDGWIEYIQDSNTVTCPSSCDDYSGPSNPFDDCCIRGTQGCDTCSSNIPGCQVTCRNNYVFIRQPDGVWYKISHFQTGSVVANGWQVGDWIEAGEVLGLEGDVGRAQTVHAHLEFGVPDVIAATPPNPGDPGYDPLGIDPANCNVCGFPNGSDDDAIMLTPPPMHGRAIRQNRIPVFCQQPFPLVDGEVYTAGPCDGLCQTDTSQLFGAIPDDNVFYRQVTDTITVSGSGFTVEAGAGAAVRAGTRVNLGPGFTAENGAYFSASIDDCDRPGF